MLAVAVLPSLAFSVVCGVWHLAVLFGCGIDSGVGSGICCWQVSLARQVLFSCVTWLWHLAVSLCHLVVAFCYGVYCSAVACVVWLSLVIGCVIGHWMWHLAVSLACVIGCSIRLLHLAISLTVAFHWGIWLWHLLFGYGKWGSAVLLACVIGICRWHVLLACVI